MEHGFCKGYPNDQGGGKPWRKNGKKKARKRELKKKNGKRKNGKKGA